MDFDESKSEPPSARTLLYNQVKEQSDLCDVTIKHGLWEKKFHWCVLVASPFFENIRKHSYRERDTGMVAMHVGTPVSLEEAILYVYGKKPKINSSNVAALLEIAEYLIISGLKAKCVTWIKSAKITDESCLDMIKLASLYDFSLSSYQEYMEGRLPDLMQMDEMMDLTVDSVEYILEDAVLSYVKASEKFSFLVRWTTRRQNRNSVFEQFLKHIDFADMERSFVTDVVMNDPLVRELDASSRFIAQLESLESRSSCEILLFPDKYYDNKLPCYDMNRRRWCSLNIESEEKRPGGFYNSKMRAIEFVRGKDGSEAYIYEEDYNKKCVYIINFENNSVKQSDVKYKHSHDTKNHYSNGKRRYVQDDELILISNQEAEYHRDENDPEEQPTVPVELLHMYMFASHPFERAFASTAINSRFEKRQVFLVSQLSIGKIENDVTTTVPILSLKGTVSDVCANKTTIIMLQRDSHALYLYNRKDSSLETIDLKAKAIRLESSDKIAEAGDGFVIYDNERLVSIAKQIGPSLLNNYLINEYKWCQEKPKDSYLHKYYFCENRWYHFCKNTDRLKRPVFESTTHEKLMVAVQDQSGIPEEIWEDLPVYEARYGGYEDPGPKIFQIKVSKERLSCAFNCPHCKHQREAKRGNYRDDDDDGDSSLYDDDSDGYYGYSGTYGYDFYDSDSDY